MQIVRALAKVSLIAALTTTAATIMLCTNSGEGPDRPPAPTGLTASPIDTQSIRLTWNADATVDSFRIYRNDQVVASVSTPSFLDNGLIAGTSYRYSLSSLSSRGESSRSPVVSATTRAAPISNSGVVTLTNPNGGEVFFVGDTVRITWTTSAESGAAWMLAISPDEGETFIPFAQIRQAWEEWKSGPYEWVVDSVISSYDDGESLNCISETCIMRIYDYNDRTTKDDESDGVFSIRRR